MSDDPNPSSEEILDRNLAELLSRANPPRIAPAARMRILEDLKARAPERSTHRGTVLLAAAAALFVGAVGSIAGFLTGGEALATYENPDVAPQEFELPDGSTVILRQGATLETLGPRRYSLLGEAFFDVVSSEVSNKVASRMNAREFVVEVPGGEAVVLGTRFLVQGGDESRLAVAEGEVRIENEAGSEVLVAGEQGELKAGTRPTRSPAPRLSHLAAWTRPSELEETERPTRNGTLLARMPNWQEREYPLPVRDLTVDVYIENQVARVAIDQTFFNEQPQQLEGVYSFPLPPGAAISRLAMYVDDTLMEAGIVERQRARRIYDSIVYERRDPALLEWMEGNRFKVRIFPLPARTEKRILLSYTQPLTRLYDDYQLEVPIPALDHPVGKVRYRVRVADCGGCKIGSTSHPLTEAEDGQAREVSFVAEGHRVGRDLLVTVRDPLQAPRTVTGRRGDHQYWMTRLRPDLGGAALPRRPDGESWVFLYDTSASRRPPELRAQSELLTSLLRQLGRKDRAAVVAFDTTVRNLAPELAPPSDLLPSLPAFLAAESQGIGATDLEAALTQARALLDDVSPDNARIVYLGDGMVTADERTPRGLSSVVEGHAELIAVAVGEQQDPEVLRGLVDATGGYLTTIRAGENLEWRAFDLMATLRTPRAVDLDVELLDQDGASIEGADTYLSSGQAAAGEELTLVSRLGATVPVAVRVKGQLAGQPFEQTLTLGEAKARARYLPRLWARERIRALIADHPEKHREELIRLGRRHFLMTPYTSLLVLENDEMYEQFGVPRDRSRDWAHYHTPRRIDVVHEPYQAPREAPIGAEVLRSPNQFSVAGQPFAALPLATEPFTALLPTAPPPHETAASDFFVLGNAERRSAMTPAVGAGERSSREQVALERNVAQSAGVLALQGTGRGGGGTGEGTIGLQAGPATDAPDMLVGTNELRGAQSSLDLQTRARLSELGYISDEMSGLGRLMGDRIGQSFGWGGLGLRHHQGLWSPSDSRLQDLSGFVPGLFSQPYDRLRHHIRRRASGQGSVSEEARRLIESSRSRSLERSYQLPNGATLTVLSDGSFETVHESALPVERTSYHRGELTHRYPNLGLLVRREISEVALYLGAVPWLLAAPESYAHHFHVTVEEQALVLRVASEEVPFLRYRFDAGGTPSAIDIYRDGSFQGWLRIDRDLDRVRIETRQGHAQAIAIITHRAIDEPAPQRYVEVVVPLRQASHWEQDLATKTPGSDEWRDSLRQLLAFQAAMEDASGLRSTIETLSAHAAPERGEMVLASRAGYHETFHRTDPIAAYLRSSSESAAPENSLIGMLESYRSFLSVLSSPTTSAERLRTFAEKYPSSTLRWPGAEAFGSRHGHVAPEEAVAIYERVGEEPQFRWTATAAACQVWLRANRYDRAADCEEARVLAELHDGRPLLFNYSPIRAFISSTEGPARLQRFHHRLRDEAFAQGTVASYRTFLSFAAFSRSYVSSALRDVERTLAQILRMELSSEDRVHLSQLFQSLGQRSGALRVLAPATESADASVITLRRAGDLAIQEGQAENAARYYERAVARQAEEGAPLSAVRQLRGAYLRSLDRASLEAAEPDPILAKLVAAARQWRRIDPGNPAIDPLVARSLFTHGQRSEALRHLSTAIERHPGEGSSYEVVAAALREEGMLEEADELWRRAARAEPENPTWLLRQAEEQLALGDRQEARRLLRRIEASSWHERFINVEYQAEAMRQRLDQNR
ncbi:MAG: VIT domain-containing protein [Myxococcota bacterium]